MTGSGAAPASQAWRGEFVLLAAIWGASFLFLREAALEFGPLPTAAMRVGIGALCLLPLMVWRGLGSDFLCHWRSVLVVGLLNSGLPSALFAFAVLSISTGLSSILNATTPLFGAIVAWLWLGERPNASRALGLLLGFAGVALLAANKANFSAGPGGSASGWAVLASFGACISYAVAASYTRKRTSGVPPLVLAAGSQLGATLGLALPGWWLWPAQMPGTRAWLAVLAVGVVCTALAYLLFFRLIARVGPTRTLSVTFLIPVFGVFYGSVLLGEALTPWMLACGAVILCGTALATGVVRLPVRVPAG